MASYGEWVSFDKQERRIYSHDVDVIPKLIRPLVGEAVAAAVVQPRRGSQRDGVQPRKRSLLRQRPQPAGGSRRGSREHRQGAA